MDTAAVDGSLYSVFRTLLPKGLHQQLSMNPEAGLRFLLPPLWSLPPGVTMSRQVKAVPPICLSAMLSHSEHRLCSIIYRNPLPGAHPIRWQSVHLRSRCCHGCICQTGGRRREDSISRLRVFGPPRSGAVRIPPRVLGECSVSTG